MQRVRSVDTLCRIGGEEFALIARGVQENDAIELGESLRKHIAATQLIAETPVTISIGVAQHDLEESSGNLLRRSDKNLYEAKQRGRNRVWPIAR